MSTRNREKNLRSQFDIEPTERLCLQTNNHFKWCNYTNSFKKQVEVDLLNIR